MSKLEQHQWRLSSSTTSVYLFSAVLLLSACGSMETAPPAGESDTIAGSLPPPNFTRGLILRSQPQPLYPIRARSLGLEGWVMLSFSVDPEGQVIGNTIRTVDEEPEDYFELSAINAARRMSFENSLGETIEDVRYVFRYELEEQQTISSDVEYEEIQFRELIPMRYITPQYPEAARDAGIEGYVVVDFTVTAQGAVEDIRITESEPPGVFDDAAVAAAARLRFEPRIVSDAPVAVPDVRYRFDWQLP